MEIELSGLGGFNMDEKRENVSLPPMKFEVGETVEFKLQGKWETGVVFFVIGVVPLNMIIIHTTLKTQKKTYCTSIFPNVT